MGKYNEYQTAVKINVLKLQILERMNTIKRNICLLFWVFALMTCASTPVFASNTALFEDTIKYNEYNQVDSEYYKNMQSQLIENYKNSLTIDPVSPYARTAHPTIPGDVYVSFTGTSSGLDFALVGHASIVETTGGTWCISSWPD